MRRGLVCGLALLLLIALLTASCKKKAPEAERMEAGMELLGKLEAKMLTAEGGYAIGTPVELKMEVKNISEEGVSLQFPTQQRYDFFIYKKGNLVWRWSYNKPFEETPVTVELPARESLVFSETWDTTELGGGMPGGTYQVVGVLTTVFPIATNFIEIGLAD